MEKVYIITYLMDGFHEHMRVYARNKTEARKEFRNAVGSRYKIVEIEEY